MFLHLLNWTNLLKLNISFVLCPTSQPHCPINKLGRCGAKGLSCCSAAWRLMYSVYVPVIITHVSHLFCSLSESFFMVKGAALFLQQGSSHQGQKAHPHHKHAGENHKATTQTKLNRSSPDYPHLSPKLLFWAYQSARQTVKLLFSPG